MFYTVISKLLIQINICKIPEEAAIDRRLAKFVSALSIREVAHRTRTRRECNIAVSRFLE